MSSIFTSVETLALPRSRFKYKKNVRTTYGYGKIYPCFAKHCLPSSTLRVSMQSMIKVQPMVAPSMTPQRMDVHFFFVPFRILDENFAEGYVGIHEKDDPDGQYKKGEAFDYQFPLWTPDSDDLKIGSMWDYFGLPINVLDYLTVQGSIDPASTDPSTPFYAGTNVKGVEPTAYLRRAYNMIYNWIYRDENLCDEVDLDSSALQIRSYRPDYFTKSLPFQFMPSDLNMALPLNYGVSGSGNILFTSNYYLGDAKLENAKTQFLNFYNDGAGVPNQEGFTTYQLRAKMTADPPSLGRVYFDRSVGNNTPVSMGVAAVQDSSGSTVVIGNASTNDSRSTHRIEASDVASQLNVYANQTMTIPEMRNAFQILKEAERTSRTGHRYTEYMLGHWASDVGDSRVQKPEFVGGFKIPIIIGDSIQTSASTISGSATAQGNRAGIGNAVGGNVTRWFHCVEPGLLIGLASILPQAEYMQGVDRQFILHDRLDFPRHEFCCLSEREVYTGELVVSNSNDNDIAVAHNKSIFGFQGIYNEYRTAQNQTTGQMRTLYQYWHQTRILDPSDDLNDDPVTKLNADFIEAKQVPLRVFANTRDTYDCFNVEEHFVVDSIEPITKRAVPGLTDHF